MKICAGLLHVFLSLLGLSVAHNDPIIPSVPNLPDGTGLDLPQLKFGETVRFEEMGPVIVNTDGSLRRIDNWDTMTPREQEETVKRISKRNQKRLEKLRSQGPSDSLSLDEVISSADVVLFEISGCPFCEKAKRTLTNAGIDFRLVPISKYRDALRAKTSKTSAPSVWIKGTYVGGCNDGTLPWHGVVPMVASGRFQGMLVDQSASKKNESRSCDPAILSRLKSAVRGSLAADAATMPLHWIYDQQVVADLVGEDSNPIFRDPPATKFYSKPLGTLSVYGDELQPLIQALASGNNLRQPALHEAYYEHYKAYEGRLNHITKAFVEKRDTGEPFQNCVVTDAQANGFVKVPFVVARYYASSNLLEYVDRAVASIQKGEETLHAARLAARVLECIVSNGWDTRRALAALIDGNGLPEIEAEHAKAAMALAESASTQELLNQGAKLMGLSCGLPQSLRIALAIAVIFGPDFEAAVKANILVAGDNCSRSLLIGALCAASNTEEWSPPEYFSEISQYHDWADELVVCE